MWNGPQWLNSRSNKTKVKSDLSSITYLGKKIGRINHFLLSQSNKQKSLSIVQCVISSMFFTHGHKNLTLIIMQIISPASTGHKMLNLHPSIVGKINWYPLTDRPQLLHSKCVILTHTVSVYLHSLNESVSSFLF